MGLNSTTDEVARFGSSFPHSETTRFILITAMILLLFLGVVGNVLIIATLLKVKFLRTRLNMLIVNLAIIDLIVIVFILPFSLVAMVTKRYPVGDNWCKVNFCVVRVLFTAECSNITVIALSRYLRVCRETSFKKYFTRLGTTIICLTPWMLGVLTSIKVFVAPDDIIFFPGWQMCFMNSAIGKWILFLLLVIQFPVTSSLYYCIWRKITTSIKNVQAKNIFQTFSNTSNRSQNLSCCYIFLLYTFLQTPAMVQVSFFPEADYTLQAVLASMICTNCAINCIIYGLCNKNVLRNYKRVLPTIWLVRANDQTNVETID